jgi:hypothetical protein
MQPLKYPVANGPEKDSLSKTSGISSIIYNCQGKISKEEEKE